jgi:hypothetical protein
MSDGQTFAVWGEGYSYYGPGGTWYNRTLGSAPATAGP